MSETMLEIDADDVLLTPEVLRRRGARAFYESHVADRLGGRAEETGRAALAYWVDAFLFDRSGNQQLFSMVHELGAWLESHYGCPYRWNDEDEVYELDCPVYALHETWALSPAWTIATTCSACGARPFACDHIPGVVYGGEVCSAVVSEFIAWDHVAMTANPEFVSNWHRQQRVTRDEAAAAGIVAGGAAFCRHCHDCSGRAGPSAGDLDPVGRFDQLFRRERSPT